MLMDAQNYVVTQYSAEIVNTLTNLLFMYLAAKGIRSCLVHGHDTVFMVAFIGYLLVGSGSFLFHATLKCRSTSKPYEVVHTNNGRPDATC
jgi:dihydroceramidase